MVSSVESSVWGGGRLIGVLVRVPIFGRTIRWVEFHYGLNSLASLLWLLIGG